MYRSKGRVRKGGGKGSAEFAIYLIPTGKPQQPKMTVCESQRWMVLEGLRVQKQWVRK